ncbi:MAG: DUF1015 domain-containing protein [Planctomycetes bacterium]|nr:DUF1015 domain-containing protein [Planctomycetota bacterium]
MPTIQAFRGLRYDLSHVGALSDVVAPPYDVIDDALQDALYKKHPANVIRLILNRPEPGDEPDEASQGNRYHRAAAFLRNWRKEGVLMAESEPALYVYHQVFGYGGQEFTRRGFMGRVRLERFGDGKIYPHEETHASAKADRLRLTRACKTNLSQIFGLYPDPQNEAQNLLEAAVAGETPLEAVDHLGVVHRMWPVTDAQVLSQVASIISPKPVFVADGHHRYETACNYRDALAQQEGSLPDDHPANFVLMMCIGMNDPGLLVLPTHRLFHGPASIASDELTARLGDFFKTRLAGEGPDLAETVWDELETEGDQGRIGLYAAKDGRWVVAQITDAGRAKMKELAPDRSDDWRSLGVSILHRLVIENLLGGKDWPKPAYVHLVKEVVEGLETDQHPLAAVVMPATLDHIRAVSEHGERMPPKSTYFYPKLLSGLVFNPLE